VRYIGELIPGRGEAGGGRGGGGTIGSILPGPGPGAVQQQPQPQSRIREYDGVEYRFNVNSPSSSWDYDDEYSYDDDDEEEEEEEGEYSYEGNLRYATVDEANASFVEKIRSGLVYHYGERENYYIRDLYYDMFQTITSVGMIDEDTMQPFQIQERFWFMPDQHPIAILLQGYYEDWGECECSARHTTRYGDLVVYNQDTMNVCMSRIVEIFLDHNIILLKRQELNALPVSETNVEEEEEDVTITTTAAAAAATQLKEVTIAKLNDGEPSVAAAAAAAVTEEPLPVPLVCEDNNNDEIVPNGTHERKKAK
jgi:hypothetical protein